MRGIFSVGLIEGLRGRAHLSSVAESDDSPGNIDADELDDFITKFVGRVLAGRNSANPSLAEWRQFPNGDVIDEDDEMSWLAPAPSDRRLSDVSALGPI